MSDEPEYTFVRFVCWGDVDQTEGRGGSKIVGYADTEATALDLVEHAGVQGSPGNVYVEEVALTEDDPAKRLRQRHVWGHHQDPLTKKWRHGWLDSRDVPEHDPEWAEYVRLSQKFDGQRAVAPWLAAQP